MSKITKLALILAACVLLSSCAAALIGGGAAGGYVAAKHKKEISGYTSDSWITSKIKSKYVAESGLHSFNISVRTEKGVVYLSGVVRSPREKQTAITLAKSTKGVKHVDTDHLKIRQ